MSGGDYIISESKYRELVGDGSAAELQAAYEWLYLQLSPSLEPIADQGLWQHRLAQLSTYIRERSSTGASESVVSLILDGHTLTCRSQTWGAVSGLPGVGGSFDDSAERQHQADAGPIPAGSCWIDTSQLVDLRQKWFFETLYERSWGTHRVTIHPESGTKTFGRGGFFIHGGAVPGSL